MKIVTPKKLIEVALPLKDINEAAAREKAAERRKAAIERQLINTGGQIIKRGLLKTFFGK